MLPPLRFCTVAGFLLGSCVFFLASRADARPEMEIRARVKEAETFAKLGHWDKARDIYEALLPERDFGLNIRGRYHYTSRRAWQVGRHQDPSYRKEVLSIEFGQALRVYGIVSNTLLDGSIERKKVTPAKLFRKGVEELDNALGDPVFQQVHLPDVPIEKIETFRALLRKTWNDIKPLTRKEAGRQLGEVANQAAIDLQLNPTVVAMEFACGACYAIDEYTAYLTPSQLRELTRTLSRHEHVGIGVKLAMRDNKLIVAEIADDSHAMGLLFAGDVLVSIDKKPVGGLPPETAADMLKGPIGTTVSIVVISRSNMMETPVSVQRRANMATVAAAIVPNTPFGYLQISGFSDVTVQELDASLARLSQLGMKGLVVDLRGNPGGVFESAIESARRFLEKGIITSTLHHDPKYNMVYHAKNPNALSLPVVLLVDGDTASAAEVLAGALKDNDRALLIGQTTFGKGCTQCVLKLPNALGGVPTGGLKVTVARFFSPKGVSYSGRGVVPHIFLDDQMPSQSTMADDLYVARAIAELNRLLVTPK